MISIPKKGTPERDRLIAEFTACMVSMKGVAGNASLVKNKLIVICTKVEKEWRIGRLTGIRGVPPSFVNDKFYTDEQEPQLDIFLMRLDEMAERDGFPEHYNEGWRRRDDNWAVT